MLRSSPSHSAELPKNSECGKHKQQHPLRNILQRLKDEKIAEFKQARVDKAEKAKKSDEKFRVLAEEKERKKYKDDWYKMAERRMKLDEEERSRGAREQGERERRRWRGIIGPGRRLNTFGRHNYGK